MRVAREEERRVDPQEFVARDRRQHPRGLVEAVWPDAAGLGHEAFHVREDLVERVAVAAACEEVRVDAQLEEVGRVRNLSIARLECVTNQVARTPASLSLSAAALMAKSGASRRRA